ncbi:MAG: FHA domain-containing protein [Planctomycetes bacterium]|nr:FHA domain-containing protein [Planctomycetota bacterium]
MADASDTGQPRLIVEVQTSSLAGRRFAFAVKDLRRGLMFGRAPDCNLRFDANRDLKVSGHHALVVETRDGIFVRDQGSSNGLWVNGNRCSTEGTQVWDGSEVSLGQEGAVLRLIIPGENPPASSQLPAPSSMKPPAGKPQSMTRLVETMGNELGAGDKTKRMIKEVADRLEARSEKRRANLVTMVVALLMLLVAIGAIGVWYYQQQESVHAQK